MPERRYIPLHSPEIQTPILFSFDLLEFDALIRDTSLAFRAIRSFSSGNLGQHKIQDLGFSTIQSTSFSFFDESGSSVTEPLDNYSWGTPELRIAIPESDKCFLLRFEWAQALTSAKAHAVYECSREEAVNLFQSASLGAGPSTHGHTK